MAKRPKLVNSATVKRLLKEDIVDLYLILPSDSGRPMNVYHACVRFGTPHLRIVYPCDGIEDLVLHVVPNAGGVLFDIMEGDAAGASAKGKKRAREKKP